MFKKIIAAVISTVVTAYLTKVVTEALERKPLKTRVREGKEKIVDIKDSAVQKASDLKAAAQDKASEVKGKFDKMIDEKEVQIEEDRKDF